MIIVAFIFSIGVNLGKVVVQHSSPTFFSIFYSFILSICLFLILSLKTKGVLSKTVSRPVLFICIGTAMAIMMITHMKAISLVEVSYVISVKRLSLLFGVIYGAMFFKETNTKDRFLGSAIMILGIVLITVF